ncbi:MULTISPECIES: ABC transporter substrate-binding protein [Brachymonas]|uniref:ABC transporter substrate-binding protein n=1 Tax=Brachymonas TaxID=28219 RepID=UPI002E77813C|nr:ABC transporter substrate-binding protein [Brachymonas sp. J145]MEE1654541.1 ABC transporter substrate-binding protein [Brachymonas sp. J145]
MVSRRDLLKLASLFTAAGSLPLLQACQQRQASQPNAPLRIGYLPITDATPLLVAHSQGLFQAEGLKVEAPVLFRSWAQLVEAFISGQVNLVHLLTPMTVWARYGSESPLKVLMWNHMAGSALTVLPGVNSVADLGGQTVAIPFWYSIHNVVLQHLLRDAGLEVTEQDPGPKQVKLIVMAPSDMVAALAAKSIAGFIVAEPFNAAAELQGVGKVLRFTGDVWRDHACCVTVAHAADVEQRPEWTQKVANAMVKAQLWTREHRPEVAQLLSADGAGKYTPHPLATVQKVLAPDAADLQQYVQSGAIRHPDWKQNRIDFQPYPFPSYTSELVKMLQQTHIAGEHNWLAKLDPQQVAQELVDERFVRQAIESTQSQQLFGLPADYRRTETIVA